jgi:hypothetical protein
MDWVAHFSNRPMVKLDQFNQEQISALEHAHIGYSIAQFQRGESSEAKDFLEKSKAFATEIDALAFYEAAKLFVAEENYHSKLLESFMGQMQIEFASQSWTDNVFRWIRSIGDIAWSSRVLLTAELLAQVYYPALQEATSSKMLHHICERIIDDEAFHILFQTERIARVLLHRHPLKRLIHTVCGGVLFCGTIFVVWFEHRTAVSRSLSFSQFVRSSFAYYKFAMRQIRNYLSSHAANWLDRGSLA